MSEEIGPSFFMLGGVFFLIAAWFDWDWFANLPRFKKLKKGLSRDGARVVYAAIGFGSCLLSVVLWLWGFPW